MQVHACSSDRAISDFISSKEATPHAHRTSKPEHWKCLICQTLMLKHGESMYLPWLPIHADYVKRMLSPWLPPILTYSVYTGHLTLNRPTFRRFLVFLEHLCILQVRAFVPWGIHAGRVHSVVVAVRATRVTRISGRADSVPIGHRSLILTLGVFLWCCFKRILRSQMCQIKEGHVCSV